MPTATGTPGLLSRATTTAVRPKKGALAGEVRDAYMAALLCGLFGLADASVASEPRAPATPVTPSTPGSGSLSLPTVGGIDLHQQLNHAHVAVAGLAQDVVSSLGLGHLVHAPPVPQKVSGESSTVVGERVTLCNSTAVLFRTRLTERVAILKVLPDVKMKTFVAAASKFLQQTQSLHLVELETMLKMAAGYVNKEVRELSLPPDESDTLFLGTIHHLLQVVREAIEKEANPGAILAAPLLSNPGAVKSFLTSFLQDTASIQGTAKTPLVDWLRVVFGLSPEEHNALVLEARKSCTEAKAFNDLELYIRELESSNVPTAPETDWLDTTGYHSWRMRELAMMSGFRNAYLQLHPNTKRIQETRKFLLPDNRCTLYKILLGRCIDHDIKALNADSKNLSNELSKATKVLLGECATRWQLTKEFKSLAVSEYIVNCLIDPNSGKGINEYAPKLEPLFSEPFVATASKMKFRTEILSKLFEFAKATLGSFPNLIKGDPGVSRQTASNVSDILVRVNADLNSTNPALADSLANDCVLIIKENIIQRYRILYESQPQDDALASCAGLVRAMSADIEKFNQHFPDPLVGGAVRVAGIAEEMYINNFLVEMENLKLLLKDIAGISIDQVLGPHGLYNEVTVFKTKLSPDTLATMSFDTEEFFRPFVLEWLGRTDGKWKEWVENACKIEVYKPVMSPTTMYSGSVRDVFSFFNNGLRFMKRLSTLSTAKKNEMALLFIQNMSKSLENYTTIAMNEFLILEAAPIESDFLITYEACIKLNNMIGARSQLQLILDDLGVTERDGKINPAAVCHNAKPGAETYEITICKAFDLQICDIYSSDPYVTLKFGEEVPLTKEESIGEGDIRTRTIPANLNPVIEFDIPDGVDQRDTFISITVMDEDTFGSDDICGIATQQLYLRESKYNDYLSHEEIISLKPQGKLHLRVLKVGSIDDIDFWVRKSEQILEFAIERMVHVITDRIIRYLQSEWTKIIATYTATKSYFTATLPPPPSDADIEEAMKPTFAYLDTTMSLFNEALDRPKLNAYLRRAFPNLRKLGGEIDISEYGPGGQRKTKEEMAKEREEKEVVAEKKEMDQPSVLCLLVWEEIVKTFRDSLGSVASKANAEAAKKKSRKVVTGGVQEKLVLTAVQRRHLEVLETALELIKAFYYCEVDGRHYGFDLDQLESKAYLETRHLLEEMLS
ncbi:hypothetical protein HK101_010392 [Irineochytrium annulatum]|nr:hypothetical protein HK101_010392 [Irineochytrium annulatum]